MEELTKLELQDRELAEIGFQPDGDFEVYFFSEEEIMIFKELIEYIYRYGPPRLAENFRGDTSEYTFYKYLLQIHSTNIMEDFAQKHEGDLSDFYNKLDKNAAYQGHKDWTIRDGAETRERKAYEEDGNTVKPNAIRFYWKFPSR